jgi:hypothetical protein
MAERTQYQATLPDNNIELLASYWTISAAYPDSDRDYSPFDFGDRVKSASRADSRALEYGMPTLSMSSGR